MKVVEGVNKLSVQLALLISYIEIVDLDINNNGIVDGEDEAAFLAAYGSIEGEPNYNRQLDANFDGVIDDRDYSIFYNTIGKHLSNIRDSIKTGIYERLVWPDGWDAYLVALNEGMVQEFTGYGRDGWISIQHHAYTWPWPGIYACTQFGLDTAVAAYKALGYGCLLRAYNFGHFYNIFWVGGDWHDLNNWYILEPQNGQIFCATQPGLPSMYQTTRIDFFDHAKTWAGGTKTIYHHSLVADYVAKTVHFIPEWYSDPGHCLYQIHGAGLEEPIPDWFDKAYLVGE